MPLSKHQKIVFRDTITDRDGKFIIEEKRYQVNYPAGKVVDEISGSIWFNAPGEQELMTYYVKRTAPPAGELHVPKWDVSKEVQEKMLHLAKARLAVYGVKGTPAVSKLYGGI